MNKKFNDFLEAWEYLNSTPIFINPEWEDCPPSNTNDFLQTLDIMVVKVNPKTCEIDDNEEKNIKVEIWLECGAYEWDIHMYPEGKYVSTHNYDYDCGGNTFEEAIINLANIVYNNKGE